MASSKKDLHLSAYLLKRSKRFLKRLITIMFVGSIHMQTYKNLH